MLKIAKRFPFLVVLGDVLKLSERKRVPSDRVLSLSAFGIAVIFLFAVTSP